MVVVRKHAICLLIVVQWLKSNHLTAKISELFCSPFQRQASLIFGFAQEGFPNLFSRVTES